MDLDLSSERAPLKAQLKVEGAFPITWVLYDYEPVGSGWSKTHVASGNGSPWIDLPQSSPTLKGHVLTWVVAAVDFDDDPLEVDVTAVIKGADPSSPGAENHGRWTLSKSQPRAFFSVRIVQ